MLRMQVIGPLLAVLAVPAVIVGLYIFTLRNNLAASDRVIAMERAARDDWHRKFDDLQRAQNENAAALAACTNAPGEPAKK